MAHFGLDAVEARKGDALVLRWGDDDGDHLALIDGGPSPVWKDVLHPHLQALAGTDPAGQPRTVDLQLVVVSHVDDDHINGILDLAGTIDRAQKTADEVPVAIAEVWHNAFADMAFLADFADEPDLQEAIRDADANPASLLDPSATPRADPTVQDITAGAESVRQGRQLDRLLNTIGVERNSSFDDDRDGFVRAGAQLDVEGLRIQVLAPNDALLDGLRTAWRDELEKILEREADARDAGVSALAAAFDDKSVPNQSSIVLLVEFGGRSMLLTGDARGDHIIDALGHQPGGPPLEVDLFKIPHHGSAHSNGPELFRAVRADHYVISGNGEHGNPHADTLTALFENEAGRPITLYLTNRPTAGAVKADDVAKAEAAEAVLDAQENNPDVTIVYRDDADLAVSVDLL